MTIFLVLACFLFYIMYLPVSYTFVYLSKLVDLAIFCKFLTIGWASSGWMAGTTITAALLCRCFGMCLWFSVSLSLFPSHCLYLIKVFCVVRLFVIEGWVFGLPLFCPCLNLLTCHAFTFFNFGECPIISTSMS